MVGKRHDSGNMCAFSFEFLCFICEANFFISPNNRKQESVLYIWHIARYDRDMRKERERKIEEAK